MFVSILQRFGLRGLRRSGEPLQSRADQNTRTAESGGPAESVAEAHPEAASQRRQEVKAKALENRHKHNFLSLIKRIFTKT